MVLHLPEDTIPRAGHDHLGFPRRVGGDGQIRTVDSASEIARERPAPLPEPCLSQPHDLRPVPVDDDRIWLKGSAVKRRHEHAHVFSLGKPWHALLAQAACFEILRIEVDAQVALGVMGQAFFEAERHRAQHAAAVLATERERPPVASRHGDRLTGGEPVAQVLFGPLRPGRDLLPGFQELHRHGKRGEAQILVEFIVVLGIIHRVPLVRAA